MSRGAPKNRGKQDATDGKLDIKGKIDLAKPLHIYFTACSFTSILALH